MHVETFNGGDTERLLSASMILSRTVVGRIADRWPASGNAREGLFGSPWANVVGTLAVRHYRQVGKAARRGIVSMFTSWAERHKGDTETVELVDRFLGAVLDEQVVKPNEINSAYLIDLAGKHFTKVAGRRLSERLLEAVQADRPEQVEEMVNLFRPVTLGEDEDIDFFHNEAAHLEAFNDAQQSIIAYPGAAGKFMGNALAHEQFISFCGPEKRGKTFFMLDMAFVAALQRRRTAFFEIGDLSRNQIMRRFQARVAQWPHRVPKGGIVKIPTKITFADGDPAIACRELAVTEPLTWKRLRRALRAVRRDEIRSEDDEYLKIRAYPAGTISVGRIQEIVHRWQRDGWVPDVVVIDYADLILPPAGIREQRDRINAVWEGLRALSLASHCLVVTATQANRESYDAHLLRMKHSSEDKRKLSHVTGMIGLNCTSQEKQIGVMRLNWMALREDDYSDERCVYVAGSLPLASPIMTSAWRKAAKTKANDDETATEEKS